MDELDLKPFSLVRVSTVEKVFHGARVKVKGDGKYKADVRDWLRNRVWLGINQSRRGWYKNLIFERSEKIETTTILQPLNFATN